MHKRPEPKKDENGAYNKKRKKMSKLISSKSSNNLEKPDDND